MTSAAVEDVVRREVTELLFEEARLLDEHAYETWEGLWAPDGVYWVPRGPAATSDPSTDVSIIYDDRRRIARRVRQLTGGQRPSQQPPARLRRLVANVEVQRLGAGPELEATGNVLLVEHRGSTRLWAGRATWVLRREDGQLRLVRKTVELVNADDFLDTIGFLL